MEKSMIQDLDYMRTSMGYKNTFTTSFHDGGYELKKSKISNLPSHKKSDLSIKLPFVVVFQTMEIQRLSQEIEALRVALKDSERQAFNCQSYEIQIRELTDQCHQYDVELLEYKEQIEKLNMISQKLYQELEAWKQKYQNFDPMVAQKLDSKVQQCQNLQNQISKWKDRFRALQKSKDKQMEDLKLALESQRKSVLDKEIRQLNIKFDTERGYLQGQIRKLQEAVDQRQNQITQAKYEVEALRIENQVNMDAGRKLKESENKLNRITQQLVRLNELLRRKQQEISRKDSNEEYLKQMIKGLEREKMDHQNEAIKVPQLEGAIKEWMVRFSRLENECHENGEKLQRVPVLERDLQHCTSEIERLSMIIKSKMNQVNEANYRADKFRSLYQESKKSEEKVPGLERRITEMGYQTQRCNDILKKRLIQVEQGKNRITALEKALRAFEQAEPEKRRIEQELKRQIRQVQKHCKQIKDLRKEVEKIPELQAVINDERSIREEYSQEVDRLNSVVKDKCQENETCNQKIEHLGRKVSELCNIEQELHGFRSQNNRLVQQIDAMNGKISQKSQQLDQLVNTIQCLQENVGKYKVVEEKLVENIRSTEKVIGDLEQTKGELQNCEQNLLQCESDLNEAKNTILDINNDRDMLNRNLNIKNQQLEQAQIEINGCLEQISQLREVERCYHALQEDMRVLQARLKDTEDLLRKQRARTQELQYHGQMLSSQIEKIRANGYFPEEFRAMFQQIKANAQQKDRELENLQRRQAAMDKSTEDIQGAIANICATMQVSNGEWSHIHTKIQDSTRNVNTVCDLQDQNAELRTQNLQLESQIKMLNLEILQAKVRTNTSNQVSQVGPALSATGSSTTSWSFNTVPSKKAIDSIVEDQGTSRVSTISHHKRVLSSTENITNLNASNLNSGSKSKLDEINSSSRLPSNNFNIKPNPVASQTYQFSQNPSISNVSTGRGISPSVINSYLPPAKMSSTATSRESTETYFAMKSSKTSSVREPYTFKSSYRA